MVKLTKIKSIKSKGKTPVIDITTNGNNLFFANGILTHNSGAKISFEEVDFTETAESWGTPATADFMGIFGQDEDALVYKSELHMKIVKNRLGGQVSEKVKFYTDKKSLKIYGEDELNRWIEDAKRSGDVREVVKQER